MPESRIKLKELASQIGKDPKDLLPAAQKLGSSIKSVQGSVSEEEAQRLRQQFAAPQEDARAQGEGVKVRRRHAREEAPARAAAVVATPEAPAAPTPAPAAPAAPAPAPPAAVETFGACTTLCQSLSPSDGATFCRLSGVSFSDIYK